MNSDKRLIGELVLQALEGCISEEDFNRLQEMIIHDPAAQEYYFEFLTGYIGLIDHEKVDFETQGQSDYYSSLLNEFADYEMTAPAVEIELPTPEKAPVKMLKVEKTPRVINKFSVYSAVISTAAALIFLMLFVKIAPTTGWSVATITDSMNAQWSPSEHPTEIGDRLWNNEGTRWLLKGTIKIAFDYGAEVIIEGPAEFELDGGDEMVLHSGRLYATVPKGAAGFTVQTPYSTVIDLGTEFGVEVDFDGSTDVHMFKGKASLIPGAIGEKGDGIELTAGQAKEVTKTSQVRELGLQQNAFVRRMDSKTGFLWRGENLNLADMVGGGNGLGTGRVGSAIDPLSGQMRPTPQFDERDGTNKYALVRNCPFIDGVFVPDGEFGPVQVSSQNHYFEDCPDTGNQFYADIVNGGRVKDRRDPGIKSYTALLFNDQEYGTSRHPALLLHSNGGITFDLEAIRQLLPEAEIVSFTSLCGLTDVVRPRAAEYINRLKADFFVLVDGEVRFEHKGVRQADEPDAIKIDLDRKDRFLTLIVSDGDGGYGEDYSFFAEPVLILK